MPITIPEKSINSLEASRHVDFRVVIGLDEYIGDFASIETADHIFGARHSLVVAVSMLLHLSVGVT
jgi:hypothetical protein